MTITSDNPATPKKTANTETTAAVTPLSPNAKKTVITKIQKIKKDNLQDALLEAVLALYPFPKAFSPELPALQEAYRVTQGEVKKALIEPIRLYIASKGAELFKAIEEEASETNSALLLFLAGQLNIKVTTERLVEVAIQEGKVYWRIMEGDQVIYDRAAAKDHDFDFSKVKCCSLTWEQFRQFKDSGKRGGTVTVTKEKFIAKFTDKFKNQAAEVWQELCDKRIINNKLRLSVGWRLVSNKYITLASLDKKIIYENVRDILKKLGGKNKNKPISRNTFVAEWPTDKKIRAGLIWDELKNNNKLDEHNKVTSFKFALADFLETLHLTYQDIADTLYQITINPDDIEDLSKYILAAKIYRPETSKKIWSKKGLLENDGNQTSLQQTQQWHVSTYADLVAHRNSTAEKTTHNGDILNYDHIPSSSIVSQKAKVIKYAISNRISVLQQELATCKKQIADIETSIRNTTTSRTTRSHTQAIPEDETITQLNNQHKLISDEIKIRNLQLESIEKDLKGHGPNFWTIAITADLHRKGETYLRPTRFQAQATQHHFIHDISCYIKILAETQFSSSIALLGAARYLFKCQKRTPELLGGHYDTSLIPKFYDTSLIPQCFFQNSTDNAAIDHMLIKGLQHCMTTHEGIHPAIRPSVVKKFDF